MAKKNPAAGKKTKAKAPRLKFESSNKNISGQRNTSND